MSGLADAQNRVVPDVSANTPDHGGRQPLRHHDRALFDMQFQISADRFRVEQLRAIARRA
jgi:hypothetical protein